jgi:putative FmdB family regulatory protein
MPLYEYQCDACGHRFEVIRKFSDSPLETCPKCGGAVRKLQSAPAFHLKGSGWYVTDYAKKDGGSGEKSGEATAAKDGKSTKDTPAASSEPSTTAKTDTTPSAPSSGESTKSAG